MQFRTRVCLAVLVLASASISNRVFAGYSVGQTVSDFALREFGTSQYVRLHDFKDHVIVLDFFAPWCEPCRTASSELEPYVQQYYDQRGGNRYGVPVQLISMCIDRGSPSSVTSYINDYGLELVLDDGNRSVYSRYTTGGIPRFAIINGVENSNYDQWEIIFLQSGYGSGSYNTFRSHIDRVQQYDPPPLPGDLDADGMVNSDDLDIVRSNWGSYVEAGHWELGDPTGDGVVNSDDLDIVRSNWGNHTAGTVPEPRIIGLLAAGLAALFAGRRR